MSRIQVAPAGTRYVGFSHQLNQLICTCRALHIYTPPLPPRPDQAFCTNTLTDISGDESLSYYGHARPPPHEGLPYSARPPLWARSHTTHAPPPRPGHILSTAPPPGQAGRQAGPLQAGRQAPNTLNSSREPPVASPQARQAGPIPHIGRTLHFGTFQMAHAVYILYIHIYI